MRTSILQTVPLTPVRKRAHAVHFYQNDRNLLERLAPEIEETLLAGGSAVVIATEPHRNELTEQLKRAGLDLETAARRGCYSELDASETLATFLSGNSIDENLFRRTIGAALSKAIEACSYESAPILAFGEMVALLWERGMPDAALTLERLWNNLIDEHSFKLLCAYPMKVFRETNDAGLFRNICEEHAEVFPVEQSPEPLTEENYRRAIARMQHAAEALDTEKTLRLSEARFRLLVESVQDYAIFLLDATGHVSSWNKGARRIKGYEAEDIIGRHFSRFYPEEDIRAGKPQMELEVAARIGRFEDEGWRLRKDGSRFWANVIITALRDTEGNLVGFAKVTRDMTDKMRAQESLEESRDILKREVDERIAAEKRLEESETSLRILSRSLFHLQDEERRHLGRELHDSIGQYLSALKMELDSMQFEPALQKKPVRDQLDGTVRIVEQCIKEIRTMSYLLYPPLLEEMGLKMAIPWYVDGFSKRSGVHTRLQISNEFGRLPRESELALFRVLQECLTNVHRHSGSRTAIVRLFLERDEAVLEVADAGKGLPTTILEFGRRGIFNAGIGMRAMSERLRALGGRLELSSEKGTTVRASIPCACETAAETIIP